MKKLLITLTIFCTAQSLFAQSDKLFVSDSSSSKLQQQLLFPNRIIGKTNNGTIYALPQDNMPVFVSDSSFISNMPVSGRTIPIGTVCRILIIQRKITKMGQRKKLIPSFKQLRLRCINTSNGLLQKKRLKDKQSRYFQNDK